MKSNIYYKFNVNNNILSVLNVLVLITALWLCKRMFSSWNIHTEALIGKEA